MIFLLVNTVKITTFDIWIKLYTDKPGMMDGHGQIARKNDGPRALPVARVCPYLPVPVLPVLKKSDIARLCP